MEQNVGTDIYPPHEEETDSIIYEMKTFIEDMRDFIVYALIVKEFKNNPPMVRVSTQNAISQAQHHIDRYEEALSSESTEELEARGDAIWDEIDDINEEMAELKSMLDSYLAFHEDEGDPSFRWQFGNCNLIIADAAEC